MSHLSSVLPHDPTLPGGDSPRLDVLRRLALEDTATAAALDRLTQLGADLLGVPMALVALAGEERQHFVSQHGLPEPWASRREARLPLSLFQQTTLGGDALLIEDVRAHPLVREHRVVPEMDVVAYAGVPLRTGAGEVLGAFCVLDTRARSWKETEVELLDTLARSTAAELELRLESEERRRALAALQRSEELYRQLVESASDLIFRADRAGYFTYANAATTRVTGYSEDEILGMHFAELVRPDSRQRVIELYSGQLEAGVAVTYSELPILTRSGEEVWIGQNVQLLRENGRLVGVQAVARDITAQRRAQQALQESEERFRTVVESLGEGLLITDGEDHVLYANPATERITGYTLEELLGRRALEVFLAPEERAAMQQRNVRRLEGAAEHYEVRMRRKDEQWVDVRVVATPIRDAEDRVFATLGAITDVTEQKRAEAALLESEERFRLVTRATNDVIWDWVAPEGRVYWSEAISRVLGYAEEAETSIEWWHDRIHPADRERVLASVDEALQGGAEVWSAEYSFQRADGSYISVLDRGYIARDSEGRPVRMSGAMLDLTQHKLAEEALARSHRYFRSLTENAQDLIHVINADRTTRYLSPSVKRLLGYDAEEMIGRPADEMIHPDDVPEAVAAVREIRRSEDTRSVELRVRHRDGSWRVFEATIRNLLDEPAVEAVVINSRDVTERKRAEAENQRLAALSRENPNPVVECDARGRPVHANPAAQEISQRLGMETIAGLLPENHAHMVRVALEQGNGFQNVEVSIGDRIFSWTYRPHVDAGVVHLFAVDITGRRLMEEQLRHDALHDALTGLPNRLLFMERLAHVILRAKRREDYLFAVLFLDLDRFKVINDSLGHHVGDELLSVVAQRLQRCLRTEDTVARFGGDEFAILMESISGVSDAIRVAERIQAELSAPVHLSGFDVFTSASIGIAPSSSAYERPEYLLRNADMAMYRAKANGHARFEVFDRAMHAEALSRLQLETDLRRALERDEFSLYFQPIVDLSTGRIAGLEALLRWCHPDRGWMMPDAFIPVAEETGLILPIGRWVLREACRRAAEWRARFGESVAASMGVNLSAKQFSQADLVEQIRSALEESRLPPGALRLEITESAVMENADTTVVLLERLKALGVQLSVDDFGTGYSSLSYLHRFPLDALKIDRSFVGRMHTEERSRQLVQTVLALARSLGVVAVAEGIESTEQLAALRGLEAEYGQGFLFARPLPPEEIESLLARQPNW